MNQFIKQSVRMFFVLIGIVITWIYICQSSSNSTFQILYILVCVNYTSILKEYVGKYNDWGGNSFPTGLKLPYGEIQLQRHSCSFLPPPLATAHQPLHSPGEE